MLAELEFDHNTFTNPSQQETNLAVRFFVMAVKNEDKSTEAGRPIYDDVEMVEIMLRGDRNNVTHKPVDMSVKRRFPQAYQAYKLDSEVLTSGTPLKEWPHAGAALVEEMKHLGFSTVEQLAEAADSVCVRVPGLAGLKQRAIAFLALAKGAAPLEKLQSQFEEEKSKREVLEAQVAELSKLLSAKEKTTK